jgi:hypothetical protein
LANGSLGGRESQVLIRLHFITLRLFPQTYTADRHKESNIEHIFAQIPSTGMYEIWVEQWDDDVNPPLQDYALAWWAVSGEGDYSDDGNWDESDLNMLTAAVAAGSTDLQFDLDGDGLVTIEDVTDQSSGWLSIGGALDTDATSGLPYLPGDANLDGFVNGVDFVVWNNNKFANTSDWTRADFNGDGSVNGQDYVIWNRFKFQDSATVPMTGMGNFVAIPEPSSLALLLLCLVGCRNRLS